MTRIVLLVLMLCAISIAADRVRAVNIAWSPVGNPGNAADTTGFGAVGYTYNIATYDVTNAQYAEFLNAKVPDGADELFLYNSSTSSAHLNDINYNAGNANGSKYSVISGDGNLPVNFVTFYDTLRFANWMNNGQGSGDTETGAYTLGALGAGGVPINGDSITRNAGATVFLQSENEWYKAAYYNSGTNSYFEFPTSGNLLPLLPIASGPTATPNSANFANAVGHLTDVGAYTGTPSPYGAFDMGGNVWQWNDTLIGGTLRGLRGAAFDNDWSFMLSSFRGATVPQYRDIAVGFRVANIPTGYVPEPSSLVLAAIGFIGLVAYGVARASIVRRIGSGSVGQAAMILANSGSSAPDSAPPVPVE